jgi:hypothetical protein
MDSCAFKNNRWAGCEGQRAASAAAHSWPTPGAACSVRSSHRLDPVLATSMRSPVQGGAGRGGGAAGPAVSVAAPLLLDGPCWLRPCALGGPAGACCPLQLLACRAPCAGCLAAAAPAAALGVPHHHHHHHHHHSAHAPVLCQTRPSTRPPPAHPPPAQPPAEQAGPAGLCRGGGHQRLPLRRQPELLRREQRPGGRRHLLQGGRRQLHRQARHGGGHLHHAGRHDHLQLDLLQGRCASCL